MRRILLAAALGLLAPGPVGAQPSAPVRLDVDEAVRLALENNPTFRQAQANVSLAEANRMSALAGLLPRFSGNYTYSDSRSTDNRPDQPILYEVSEEGDIVPIETQDFALKGSSTFNNWGFGVTEDLSLSQLYSWRSQAAAVAAQRHGRDASAQTLAYNTRSQFYLTLRAEALLEVQQRDYDLAQNELRRTRTMFELGSVARADVLKARVRVSEAEVALIRQANAVQVAHSQLAQYLGMDPTTRFDLVGDLEIAPVEVDSLRAVHDAVRRPDMLQAEADLAAAGHGYTAAWTSRFPALFASYNYNASSGDFESQTLIDNLVNVDPPTFARFPQTITGSTDNTGWTVRVGVSLALDAFLNFSQDKAARAQKALAAYRREALELAVRQEVEQALLEIRASLSAIAAAEQGVVAAEEDLRLSRERYEQGLGTFLDLLQAQVALTRARSTLVDAKTSLKIAEAGLDRARGAPVHY